MSSDAKVKRIRQRKKNPVKEPQYFRTRVCLRVLPAHLDKLLAVLRKRLRKSDWTISVSPTIIDPQGCKWVYIVSTYKGQIEGCPRLRLAKTDVAEPCETGESPPHWEAQFSEVGVLSVVMRHPGPYRKRHQMVHTVNIKSWLSNRRVPGVRD